MDNDIIEYTDENQYNAYDEYFSDEEIDHIISDNDDDKHSETNPYVGLKIKPPIRWTIIKIGRSILEVSTNGTIKPYRSLNIATEGTLLEGTPYRYYRVEESPNHYKNYFVHEIIWQAFYGTPSNEYRITHKPEYTNTYRKVYSNKLHNITLVRNIEVEAFKLNKSV
jgi:hypothetical protein